MTEAIIRHHSLKLVRLLPMDDVIFMTELDAAGLLPGDLWDEIESKGTRAKKAAYFLRHGIRNDTGSFNKLLTIMREFNDIQLKKLAEMINGEIGL